MFAVLAIILIPFIGYWVVRKTLDRMFDLPVLQEVKHIGDKPHCEVSKNGP